MRGIVPWERWQLLPGTPTVPETSLFHSSHAIPQKTLPHHRSHLRPPRYIQVICVPDQQRPAFRFAAGEFQQTLQVARRVGAGFMIQYFMEYITILDYRYALHMNRNSSLPTNKNVFTLIYVYIKGILWYMLHLTLYDRRAIL